MNIQEKRIESAIQQSMLMAESIYNVLSGNKSLCLEKGFVDEADKIWAAFVTELRTSKTALAVQLIQSKLVIIWRRMCEKYAKRLGVGKPDPARLAKACR